MRVVTGGSFIAALAIASASNADCIDVIKASSLKGMVIEKSDQIAAEARAFCSEYSKSKSSGGSFNASVSYAGIGLGAGSSSSKVEQTASKYCDASDMSQAKSNYYEQYIESIAPGAYSSYDRCLAATADSLTASLDPNATHPKNLTIVVSSKRTGATGALDKVQFIPSPGISCTWKNQQIASQDATILVDLVSLPAQSSVGLFCTRDDETQQGSITLVTSTTANSNFSFLWKSYQNGLPVDELQAIKEANTQLLESMASAVVAFNAETCPAGWKPSDILAGRTIVGAGSGSGLTARSHGTVGGTETHVLTVAEMPSHSHSGNVSTGGHSYEHHKHGGPRLPGEHWQSSSGITGQDQPHNNMQPYAVMTYCEREIM